MWILPACLLAFCATFFSLRVLARLAPRLDLLDMPGGHRWHVSPTPVVGGLAMFCGVVLGLLLYSPFDRAGMAYLLGAAILVLVGYLDDRRLVGTRIKTLGQILAAATLCVGGDIVIHHMGNLLGLGDIQLGWFAWPFTIFAIVGLVNAVNMIDGSDGLAGGVCLAAALSLAFVAFLAGAEAVLVCSAILSAAILGLLPYNLRIGERRARVFMGDTGSMLLGFSLAWLAIWLSQEPISALHPMSVIWVFVVPLLDTFRLMALRASQGMSIFTADTRHVHHLLIGSGVGVNQLVLLAMIVTFSASAFALLIERLPLAGPVLFYTFIVMFFVYLWLAKRWERRSVSRQQLAMELE